MKGPATPDFSRLPSMTTLLEGAAADAELRCLPRGPLTDALREAADELRDRLRRQEGSFDSADAVARILQSAREKIASRRATRLTRVINATGVILHTGLGRSVLAESAVRRLADVAAGYCSLEIDLSTGQRGRRGQYAEQLLCQLTGAEAAMIVNNNAAATMLALRGMAAGREVLVSRGQLIEIGGSYRLPDVMVAGGAVLREVGTTNKTHLRDYEAAINDNTAMIMHVHTSNYRVVGFAESPGVAELTRLAHSRGLVMFDDLGSGALLDDDIWRAANEPTVIESLRTGADFVAFSGDKLLGGPQAGVLLGRRETIDRLRRDPMARALRVDKLIIAALEATLELYQDPAKAKSEIPILAALSEPIDSLTHRAEELAAMLREALPAETLTVAQDESFAGGGSLPAWPLPTAVVRWTPIGGTSVDDIARKLRIGDPAVLVRINQGAICLDVRTIPMSDARGLTEGISLMKQPC
ncbi:MAG: L-seryl-tRNA(Sec) selenium transferase [Planctomycetota bacterium]|nr:MAG: L-seryl-tRNA(Sec) selenium transferase [Planctomycetota bacterium]